MKTTDNYNNIINKTVEGYNVDAQSAYMQSILGKEMWERHKPTRNISDFLTRRANDNQVAV